MRPIRLKVGLAPRIGQRSLLNPSSKIGCLCFHTCSIPRLPNPYSKRPTEFPQPADNPPTPPPTDPNHGLYGFFRNKKSVTPPKILSEFGILPLKSQLIQGRPWTAEELRRKSWEDLHVLWYKCLLERNIIATEAHDARKQGVFFAIEDIHRDRGPVVKRTMARIKFVLWERYRAWWGAHQLNEEDPFLIDRMRAEDEEKRKQAKRDEWAKMSKEKKRKFRRMQRLRYRERKARREEAMIQEKVRKLEAEKDAQMLEEFQKLAVGGRPEDKTGIEKI